MLYFANYTLLCLPPSLSLFLKVFFNISQMQNDNNLCFTSLLKKKKKKIFYGIMVYIIVRNSEKRLRYRAIRVIEYTDITLARKKHWRGHLW